MKALSLCLLLLSSAAMAKAAPDKGKVYLDITCSDLRGVEIEGSMYAAGEDLRLEVTLEASSHVQALVDGENRDKLTPIQIVPKGKSWIDLLLVSVECWSKSKSTWETVPLSPDALTKAKYRGASHAQLIGTGGRRLGAVNCLLCARQVQGGRQVPTGEEEGSGSHCAVHTQSQGEAVQARSVSAQIRARIMTPAWAHSCVSPCDNTCVTISKFSGDLGCSVVELVIGHPDVVSAAL